MATQTFNLNERYPQVIVVGNGLVRNNGVEWTEFIESCKRSDVDLSTYKEGKKFLIPNNILTLLSLPTDDSVRHKKYAKQLERIKYCRNELIESLVSLPADAILTTNYTYELEYAINHRYPDQSEKAKRKYMHYASSRKVQEKKAGKAWD